MNLLTIFSRFPDQEACIEYLEKVRWAGDAHCPYCGSATVARKADSGRTGRWNCHGCKSSFNVLAGTIFEKTRLPLQKWFLAIGILVNAKKSVSSFQLARDLDMNQKSAWYMQQRIRAAMLTEDRGILEGIVEADETYVGGKPRKGNKRDGDGPKNKRGRGTKKVPVLGAIERGGRVVARVAEDLTGKGILRFLRGAVNPKGTLLITDEFKSYAAATDYNRAVINHRQAYAEGLTHTNTIEGFWALVKRAWYGQHHHYSRKFMPLYIAEACWKHNNRNNDKGFAAFMRGCFA